MEYKKRILEEEKYQKMVEMQISKEKKEKSMQ